MLSSQPQADNCDLTLRRLLLRSKPLVAVMPLSAAVSKLLCIGSLVSLTERVDGNADGDQ